MSSVYTTAVKVHLAFFSGNVCYWQIRLETSVLTEALDRTIVSYKETMCRSVILMPLMTVRTGY